MRTVDFRKVEQAFHAALAARQRAAPIDLEEICQHDTALLAEVEALLKHFEQADSGETQSNGTKIAFLDPAELHVDHARPMLEEWGATTVGQRVGNFMLIEQIGSGAMGVVFLAEQDRPKRTVALKIIRRNVATPAMVRRFEREAQLLGRLNHAGIAQVYDAGVAEITTDSHERLPVPYIAMEYVEGPTIIQFVREHPRNSELALKLMAQVCDAIQHAHQRGIIHRDLKPANILVTVDPAGQPQVKVLDFGVARQADRDSTYAPNETHLTLHGHFIGTPAYMSPEQMRSSQDLDTRSDIYALGAILYQLLTDRLPILTADCSLAEAARRIEEKQPTRLGVLRRELRGDVETIVAKALEKDPQRRYQSAAELCRDIQHHLAGEMIEVRRDSLMYLMAKKAARYRNMLFVAALLVAAGVGFGLFARHQQQNELLAKRDAESARRRADEAASKLATELSATRIEEGRLLGEKNDLASAEKLLWDEWFEHPNSLAANWALRELYWRSQCIRTFAADATECRTLAIAPDDRSFATGGGESVIRIWSFPAAAKLAELQTGLSGSHSICYLPSGHRIAVAGDGGARIVDLQTRAVQTLGEADIASYTVDCASTGLALAVGGEDGVIRLFDPDTHKLIASIESDSSPIRAVRFDNSCYHLAAIHLNGVVNLWQLHLEPDAATVIPLGPIEGHPGWAGTALAFSPDGQMLVTGGTDRTIKLWRIPDGALAQQFVTNNGPVRALAFSSDGQRIVVPGFWRTQVYDVSSGAMTALGDGGGFDAKFVGDGTAILGGTHGACRIWNFDLAASVIRSTASPVRELAAASVGTDCLLATLQLDGTLRLLKRPIQSPRVDEWQNVLSTNVGDHSRALAMSPDARWLVVGRTDGHLLTVRAADGQIVQDWPAHHKLVDVLRISPDGQTLVSGGSDGVILIARQRQDHNGWEQVALRTRPGEVDGIAISPDGNRFVTSSKMTSLDFWSVPDGTLLREISLPFTAWKLALSHDGSRLAVGMWDRSVQIWNTSWMQSDPSTVQEEMNLVGHTQLVTGQAFDSTGTLMASVSTDGTVRVWDFSGTDRTTRGDLPENRRRCLASFNAHAGDANAVTFLPSPDGMGDSLAVGFIDGTVRFWHLESLPNILNGHIRYQQQVRGIVTSASADH